MHPALAGGTPSPRGPYSVGGSPGWASSSALVGWPSPERLPQCPPCFPPGPVPCIRWVECGQAPMANLSPPSAGVHRHTCVVCMGQHDLVLVESEAVRVRAEGLKGLLRLKGPIKDSGTGFMPQ